MVRPIRTSDFADDAAPTQLHEPAQFDEMYPEVRTCALFDGLPNELLAHSLRSHTLEVIKLERDALLLDVSPCLTGDDRAFFVLSGQIGVAIFAPEKLKELLAAAAPSGKAEATRQDADGESKPKKKRKNKQEPLVQLAQQNLATFGMGDLFLASMLPQEGTAQSTLFAIEPTTLLALDKQHMSAIASEYAFFQARMRRAIDLARSRWIGLTGLKLDLMDFFVRHGISVSSTVRVRQIDRCIECKQCEVACQERFGEKRLTIHGPRLGMLDFVKTCHTCTDQRCIEACNFDAIHFDAERGEVRITEEKCMGTGACARACPYQSIEMVDVESASPSFLDRMREANAFGAHKKAKVKRLPNKCDHCVDYGEQACVAACPTGALLEIQPNKIFQDGGQLSRAAAADGYDHTVVYDAQRMFPTQPFQKGLGITTGDQARVPRRHVSPRFYWSLALIGWLAAASEILLRRFWPVLSLTYLQKIVLEGAEPELALGNVDYKPGSTLAVTCGYVGTALILMTMGYVIRRHSKWLQRFGATQNWFEFHLMCGIMGPSYILLHSALKLDNWVSLAFFSMVGVVASGLIGRFLYVQIPKTLGAEELVEQARVRALEEMRASNRLGVTLALGEIEQLRKKAAKVAQGGLLRALGFLLVQAFSRRFRGVARFFRYRAGGASLRDAFAIARHVGAVGMLERRRVALPHAQALLTAWKKIHVPFTIIMGILVTIHVVIAIKYSL